MKRKAAVCKCGRTVECRRRLIQDDTPDSIDSDVVYEIKCPCGAWVQEYSPLVAWAEWKRLQVKP